MTQRTLFSLVVLASAACGSDSSGPGEKPPPVPAAVSARVSPARSLYRTDQRIQVEASVTDSSGAAIANAEVVWTAVPTTAIDGVSNGETTLLQPGRLVLTACAGSGEATVCDDIYLVVDDGAPVLELSAPQPGAELGGDGAMAIEVVGSVADQGVPRVFVNGVPVELDDTGRFAASIVPTFGVNHIEVVASDGLTRDESRELDVMWADGYLAAVDQEGHPSLSLDDGLVLQLAQGFFDDGQPLNSDPPLVTRDLADIIELVVANVDFADALPDPVIDNLPTFFLRIPAVRLGEVQASVAVTDHGAELFVRMPAVEADTEGTLSLGAEPLDLAGGINASLSIAASLTITAPGPDSPPDSQIEATLDQLSVAIEEAEGRFASEEANAVFELAEGALRTTLERELVGAVDEILASALPQLLTSALNALDTALRDQTINIDTDVFPKLTLELDGRIGELETALARGLRATLTTRVGVASPGLYPGARGVPQIVAEPGMPLFASRPVQLAVRADLLNGVVQGLWNGGLLTFDATPILPDAIGGIITQALIDGKLPPVVRPARGVEVHDLMLELGQLELDLVAFDERSRFGLSIEAGVDVTIADNAISLNVAEEPTLRAWLIESEADEPRIDANLLQELLVDVLWPDLREAIVGSLSIDLPALDLGDLTDIAPALEGFALGFEMSERVDVREGFLVFDVGLLGRLPQ